ncbi:MAG: cyanophycinase [Chloroflexi bacterium]|nr:MAG: cyanophycinase [Chloroflexota bacterium]
MVNPASLTAPQMRGALMPIGGAEDKAKTRHILKRFLSLAGEENAQIVVIPAASTQGTEVGDLYQAIFYDLGAATVEVIHVDTRNDAQDPERVAVLNDATAIFLTGGNQLRLATLLGGTLLAQAIRDRNNAGVPVAGTSAGASVLSQHMIAFGRAGEWPTQRMVQLAPGLGLTNRVVIDQHFQQRGRTGRLMAAVAYNPYLIGLGIDEDTAVIIDPQNMLNVVGRGSVVVVDGAGMTYTNIDQAKGYDPIAVTDMRIHVLINGFQYDLVQRHPLLSTTHTS